MAKDEWENDEYWVMNSELLASREPAGVKEFSFRRSRTRIAAAGCNASLGTHRFRGAAHERIP